MTRIYDETQVYATVAVAQALAWARIGPDSARGESETRRPDAEDVPGVAQREKRGDESDRQPDVAREILADIADPNVVVTFVKVDGVDEPVIRVVNRDTGEVVRQIPPDEVVQLKKRFGELLGIARDLKA